MGDGGDEVPAALFQAEGSQHEPDDPSRTQEHHAPDEGERPGQHFFVVLKRNGSGVSRKENQRGVGKGECARLPGFLRGRGGRVEGCQAAVGKQHLYLAGQASVQVVHVHQGPLQINAAAGVHLAQDVKVPSVFHGNEGSDSFHLCRRAGYRWLRFRRFMQNFIPDIRPEVSAGRNGGKGGDLAVQPLVKVLLFIQPPGKLRGKSGAGYAPGRGNLNEGCNVVRQVGGEIGTTGCFSGGRGAHPQVIGAFVGVNGLVFKIAAGLFECDEGGQKAVHFQLGFMGQGFHPDTLFGMPRFFRLHQQNMGEPSERADDQQQADCQQNDAYAPVHGSGNEG